MILLIECDAKPTNMCQFLMDEVHIQLVQPMNKLVWVNFKYDYGPAKMYLHLIVCDLFNNEMALYKPCMSCKVLNMESSPPEIMHILN
jgi:hypothetical protein